jgi:hypothetical protein
MQCLQQLPRRGGCFRVGVFVDDLLVALAHLFSEISFA